MCSFLGSYEKVCIFFKGWPSLYWESNAGDSGFEIEIKEKRWRNGKHKGGHGLHREENVGVKRRMLRTLQKIKKELAAKQIWRRKTGVRKWIHRKMQKDPSIIFTIFNLTSMFNTNKYMINWDFQ